MIHWLNVADMRSYGARGRLERRRGGRPRCFVTEFSLSTRMNDLHGAVFIIWTDDCLITAKMIICKVLLSVKTCRRTLMSKEKNTSFELNGGYLEMEASGN